MEELRDEDVHLQHVRHVLAFDVTQNVDEPLEVTMRRTNPQEVDLLAGYSRIPYNFYMFIDDNLAKVPNLAPLYYSSVSQPFWSRATPVQLFGGTPRCLNRSKGQLKLKLVAPWLRTTV